MLARMATYLAETSATPYHLASSAPIWPAAPEILPWMIELLRMHSVTERCL